ncbi:MAG: RAMP superfamily CRISPR-associated protein [Leptolyngbyaceae cyanobacterium bins.302]|nr:RAMP superfamily CRISPR-associated protein [Leptolyngbyaceae cyanobacterium bins.302]
MTNDHGFSRKSGTSFERGPTPYKLISFPNKPLPRNNPPGHHKYLPNHLHGTLFLILKVETALHISVGAVVRGSDIGKNISLIKAMVQGSNQRLLIQGSSLKGCIRSVYEAITKSLSGNPIKGEILEETEF